jgi:hypothetical protein
MWIFAGEDSCPVVALPQSDPNINRDEPSPCKIRSTEFVHCLRRVIYATVKTVVTLATIASSKWLAG